MQKVPDVPNGVPAQRQNQPAHQVKDVPTVKVRRVTLKLGKPPVEPLEGRLVNGSQKKSNSLTNKHPQSHMTSDVITQTDPKNQAASDISDQNLMQHDTA